MCPIAARRQSPQLRTVKRATANPHERPILGIQVDALNGDNGTRCGQTASRWANGRFWWKLLFEAKLATTHIGRELPPPSR
jgi:hypothetical protein